MFSSRRSRNRHSANPNPKLHLPQTVRRKLPDNAGGLSMPDSATGEYEDDERGSGGAAGIYPGSPMSLSSQYALRCAAAAAGSAVHRQIVLDDDEDDDDVASNHSTAAESVSTVPEDNFMTSAAAATTGTSTPSSDTALNLVCSPRSTSSLPSTGNENGGLETGAVEPEQGASGSVAAVQTQGGGSARGTSKRKSAVPTRCSAQQLQDDELISDDNSSDVPAAKRRNVEPATSTDEASASAAEKTDAEPEKSVEPNNNKVREQDSKMEEDQQAGRPEEVVDRCGAADAEGHLVPRTSTPTADQAPDQGPGSPGACSRMSDDVSSIGSDDERKSEKAANEEKHASEAGGHAAAQSDADNDEVNDSGVVVDGVGRRDDEASGGKTVPDGTDSGAAAAAKDISGKGSTQSGFVCIMEGCNATFPSKRSRDRHSANLNLHRKLLSTSGTSGKSATSAVYSEHPFPPPVVVHSSSENATEEAGYLVLNLSRTAENPAPTAGPETRAAAAVAESADTVIQAPDTDGEASRSSSVGPEEEPATAGSDSTAVTCHVCPSPTATFRDKLALKEHLETVHPRESHRCTVAGCDKLFSTRKSRNRHSQNDNLHRHLVVAAPR